MTPVGVVGVVAGATRVDLVATPKEVEQMATHQPTRKNNDNQKLKIQKFKN